MRGEERFSAGNARDRPVRNRVPQGRLRVGLVQISASDRLIFDNTS
jgi:hypothetical protein